MYALAVGPFDNDAVEALSAVSAQAGLTLLATQGAAEARRLLRQPSSAPQAVLVSRLADVSSFVRFLRDSAQLFAVPVLAMVPHPTESEFRRAFAAGADDVLVEGDTRGVAHRMRSLAERDPAARPPAANGLALVAAADIERRRQLGRTLRQAGFEVAFASEARELVAIARANRPALVVATPDFPPLGGDAAVRSVRTATRIPDLPAVVVGEAEPGSQHGAATSPAGELRLMAEALITRGDPSEQRRSKRLAYSTICAYREAGLMEPSYGMTYDISRGGLYVRTLDPPAPGTSIWVELRTPDGEPVHLRGTVAWRKPASGAAGGSPVGFGLQLQTPQCPPLDLASYLRGYEQLMAAQLSN